MFGFDLVNLIAGLPALAIALSFHEYAHARMAVYMGDLTPKFMGRLTLNPLAHIDPIGMLMLLLVHFGWAKPVTINPLNFRDYKKGNFLVALAGPAINFFIAFVSMFVLFAFDAFRIHLSEGLWRVLYLMIVYNINFGLFNLIPLPPLDGSKILSSFLSYQMQYKLASLERYSFLIFIIFLTTPILGYVLIPLQQIILRFFSMICSFLLF